MSKLKFSLVDVEVHAAKLDESEARMKIIRDFEQWIYEDVELRRVSKKKGYFVPLSIAMDETAARTNRCWRTIANIYYKRKPEDKK